MDFGQVSVVVSGVSDQFPGAFGEFFEQRTHHAGIENSVPATAMVPSVVTNCSLAIRRVKYGPEPSQSQDLGGAQP